MLEVKKIFEELLNIDALTYDRGEVDIAKALYNIYLGLDYFKDHPENVKLLATDEDEFVRFNQMAMVQKGDLSLIHISEPTRREWLSRMPSSA